MGEATFKNYSAEERIKRAKSQFSRVCNPRWVWRVLGAGVGGAVAYLLSRLGYTSVTTTILSVVSWAFCCGVWTNSYLVFRRTRYLNILSGKSTQGSYKDLILRLGGGVDRSALLVLWNPKKTVQGRRGRLIHSFLYSISRRLDAEAALLMNAAQSSEHLDPELVAIYDDLGRVGADSGAVLEPLRNGYIRSRYDEIDVDYRAQCVKDGLRAVAALAVEFGEKPEQWAMVCSMVEIAAQAPDRDGVAETYQRVGKTVRTLVNAAAR